MYRVLVTGARDLPEPEIVWIPLWTVLHNHRAVIVTHGQAPRGADLFAHQWFRLPEQSFNRERRAYEPLEEFFALEDPHPADWKIGKHAGNVRNQTMVNLGPDVCYAFPTPKSRGTLDCMARCWVRDIPVVIWHHTQLGVWRLLSEEEGEKLARSRLGWGR